MTRKRLIQNSAKRYLASTFLVVLTGALLFASRHAFPPQQS